MEDPLTFGVWKDPTTTLPVRLSNETQNYIFGPCDLDLWPLTKVDLGNDLWPKSKWPLPYKHYLQNCDMRYKIGFFDLVTLTFDLWPRPSGSTLVSSRLILNPNFMTLGAILYEIWIIVQEFWSSHRQTDGQTDRQTESDAYEPTVQCAQVGSKRRIRCAVGSFLNFLSKWLSLAQCLVAAWVVRWRPASLARDKILQHQNHRQYSM